MVYFRKNIKFILKINILKYLLLFAFLPFALFSQEKECTEIFIKGRVSDTISPQKIYLVSVLNLTASRVFKTDERGNFSGVAHAGDTLVVRVTGYPNYEYIVQSTDDCKLFIVQYIERGVQEFTDVFIYPEKALSEIKEQRVNLHKASTRTVTGFNVFLSPITAIYETFNWKERNKRKLAEMKYQDERRQIIKEILYIALNNGIVSLPHNEIDNFLNEVEIPEETLRWASDYELIDAVKTAANEYNSKLPSPVTE